MKNSEISVLCRVAAAPSRSDTEADRAPENIGAVLVRPVTIDDDGLAQSDQLQRSGEFVGIVAQDTTVERLYFEIIRDDDLQEGRLVATQVGTQTVLYQIIDGLTREETIQQKNTYGYARGQAQKIGMWDEKDRAFKHVAWLPRPNAPVYLRKTEQFTAAAA